MTVVEKNTFTLKNSATPMPKTIHPTSLPFALANASNTNAAKHIKVPFVRKKFAHPSIAQPAYTVVRSGIEHMFIAIAENSIPLTSASTAKDPTHVATMPMRRPMKHHQPMLKKPTILLLKKLSVKKRPRRLRQTQVLRKRRRTRKPLTMRRMPKRHQKTRLMMQMRLSNHASHKKARRSGPFFCLSVFACAMACIDGGFPRLDQPR